MIGIGATRQTGAGRLEVPVNDVASRLVGHTAVLSLIVSDLQHYEYPETTVYLYTVVELRTDCMAAGVVPRSGVDHTRSHLANTGQLTN